MKTLNIETAKAMDADELLVLVDGGVAARARRGGIVLYALALAGLVGACVDPGDDPNSIATTGQAITGEDGLAEAFQVFTQNFVSDGQDQRFTIGFGFHPGLVTQRVAVAGATASGSATLVFAEGRVQATLHNVPDDQRFDLWFVKNVAGQRSYGASGERRSAPQDRIVRPEHGRQHPYARRRGRRRRGRLRSRRGRGDRRGQEPDLERGRIRRPHPAREALLPRARRRWPRSGDRRDHPHGRVKRSADRARCPAVLQRDLRRQRAHLRHLPPGREQPDDRSAVHRDPAADRSAVRGRDQPGAGPARELDLAPPRRADPGERRRLRGSDPQVRAARRAAHPRDEHVDRPRRHLHLPVGRPAARLSHRLGR